MKSLDPTHSPFDSNSSVERLESPDSDHLRAAQAWLELGNYAVSDACLDQIKAAVQSHPDVLELRWHLSACTQRWASCLGIANAVIRVDSERASGWINRSVALHKLRHTEEAYYNLMPAARRFADNSIIPYNLACYCSQLKQPTEARAWLDRAVALGDATEPWRMANQDPDLQPLMEKIDDYCW